MIQRVRARVIALAHIGHVAELERPFPVKQHPPCKRGNAGSSPAVATPITSATFAPNEIRYQTNQTGAD